MVIKISTVEITPGLLSGSIDVPPSKSDMHRAIICAALSEGISEVSPVYLSDDIVATIEAVRKVGADVEIRGKSLIICGAGVPENWSANVDCRESGSTLRFMIPIFAAKGIKTSFTGRGNLPNRPMKVYTQCLPKHGVCCKTNSGVVLEISGKLNGGDFPISGEISSQFISGLMFALPLLDADSKIILTTPLQSRRYVDMTIKTLRSFGIGIEQNNNEYIIKGNQRYVPCKYNVESDWSQAAFFMVAGAIGSPISVRGMNLDSAQGDKVIVDILEQFGAIIRQENNEIAVQPNRLIGAEISAKDIPDLVPILAVLGALSEGTTKIIDAQRLRIKESDRLEAICEGLSRLGAKIEQTKDGLLINGVNEFRPANLSGFNDHRIVMALSIASMRAKGKITITDADSVNKSYPNFFEDYKKLGGLTNVINLG